MKKIIVALLLLFLTVLPLHASAINLGNDLAEKARQAAGYGATDRTTFAATLGTVVKTAMSLLGVIFLVLMVYAGFLWMNAKGNESEIEKAQTIIRAAIIGLIIVVGAYSITYFIVPRLIQRAAGG